MRHRTPSVDALIPPLYLKGISTGDFSEALAAILGEKASGPSATNMVFKLGMEAQKRWRRLNGAELVAKVVSGVTFVDGEEQPNKPPTQSF